ncbi:MAG TPA: hypothetical protein VI959_01155 [Alphaproteobacteria bacterium]|nr:hypothetical protein [Alphaproteobacteria bacterium]
MIKNILMILIGFCTISYTNPNDSDQIMENNESTKTQTHDALTPKKEGEIRNPFDPNYKGKKTMAIDEIQSIQEDNKLCNSFNNIKLQKTPPLLTITIPKFPGLSKTSGIIKQNKLLEARKKYLLITAPSTSSDFSVKALTSEEEAQQENQNK